MRSQPAVSVPEINGQDQGKRPGCQRVAGGRPHRNEPDDTPPGPAVLPLPGDARRFLQIALPVQPQPDKEGVPCLPCSLDDLLPNVGGQGFVRGMPLELRAQGFVGRHGFPREERVPGALPDGVPEGRAAVGHQTENFGLFLVGNCSDDVCALHDSITLPALC